MKLNLQEFCDSVRLKVKCALSLTLLGCLTQQVEAQVADYSFSESNSTFNSISNTGILLDSAYLASSTNNLDTKGWTLNLPFSFVFNGVSYNTLYANSNGGATFGTTTSNDASLISGTGAYSGAMAVMNRDLWGVYAVTGTVTSGSNTITGVSNFYGLQVGSTLQGGFGVPSNATVTAFNTTVGTITMSANATSNAATVSVRWGIGKMYTTTIGTAPNRKYIIEWNDFADNNTSATNNTSRFSFQLVLEETTNKISYIYGSYNVLSTTSRTNQIGLRGATNGDFLNRAGTTSWSSTIAGAANSSSVSRDNLIYPSSGLTYTWTPASCTAPILQNINGISTNTATVNWISPVSIPNGGYEYYYATSNTAPTAATLPSGSVPNTAKSANLGSSLLPTTTYYVWLRGICNPGGATSWVGPISFTTSCPNYTTPYNQDFNSNAFAPTCWSQNSGLIANPTVFDLSPSSIFYRNTFGNASIYPIVNGAAYINLTSTNRKHWLISPTFDLGATPKKIEFDLALTANYGNLPGVLGNGQKFAVVISTDNGATWSSSNILQQWTSANTISNTGDHISIDLSAYTGLVKIAFYGESTIAGSSVDVFVDNVTFAEQSICSGFPLSVTHSNVVYNGAQLTWGAPNPAPSQGYEYYFNTTGIAPNITTTPNGTTLAGVTIVNTNTLNPNTTYYYWVRSVCSSTDKSVWIGGNSFHTLCQPFTIPFNENFNGSAFAPDCWSEAYGSLNTATIFSSSSSVWERKQYCNAAATTITDGSAKVNISGALRREWLISPSIIMNGIAKQLEFDLALTEANSTLASSLGTSQRLAVVVSYDNGQTWSNNNIIQQWGPSTPISNTGQHVSIYVPGSGDTIRFGFFVDAHGYSTNDVDLFLNNIEVSEVPCTPPIVNLGADTTICQGANLVLSPGFTPNATYLWNTNATTSNLSVTNSGTYYVTVTNGICTASDTIVVTVSVPPSVNLGNDTTDCVNGGPIQLDAGAGTGYTYTWSNGSNAQIINVTTSGTYSVVVTNADGCSRSDLINLTVGVPPTVDAITVSGTSPNFNFSSNAAHANDYFWNFGNGTGVSTQATPNYSYPTGTTNQIYTVTLIISNDCGSDTVTTEVTVSPSSIDDLNLDNNLLKLYPNPSSSILTVENKSELQLKRIYIVNALGQTVAKYENLKTDTQKLDVSMLNMGIYNVLIEFVEGEISKKIIINR